jgi:hypothetical protein
MTACNYGSSSSVVAKVYDLELYSEDFEFLFENKNLNTEDSAIIARNYISNWIEEQILVHQAKLNGQINISEIENRAEHYKNALLIHKYENIFIENNLDTIVEKNELNSYYKSHQDDFQLNDYLVKVLYLKIPIDAPEIDKIGKLYKLYNKDDINEIEAYAQVYASNFYYDEQNWMYFDELAKEIPLQDINKDKFITRKSKIKLDENDYYYFLNVIDYKLKNTLSPLEFEKDNIKQRILNIRIKELRDKLKKDNIQKAYNEKSVKIY